MHFGTRAPTFKNSTIMLENIKHFGGEYKKDRVFQLTNGNKTIEFSTAEMAQWVKVLGA